MSIPDVVTVSASWIAVSEPSCWVADRVDDLARRLSADLDTSDWQVALPRTRTGERQWQPWGGDTAALVERCRISASFPEAESDEGFAVNLHGRTPSGHRVSVRMNAGAVWVGDRLPEHRVMIEMQSAGDGAPDSDIVAEAMIRAAVEVLVPQAALSIEPALNKIARRNGWQIRPSRSLWLSDDVVVDAVLPEGMTATRLGNGCLYSIPRDLTPDEVATIHTQFRALNRIDILPH